MLINSQFAHSLNSFVGDLLLQFASKAHESKDVPLSPSRGGNSSGTRSECSSPAPRAVYSPVFSRYSHSIEDTRPAASSSSSSATDMVDADAEAEGEGEVEAENHSEVGDIKREIKEDQDQGGDDEDESPVGFDYEGTGHAVHVDQSSSSRGGDGCLTSSPDGDDYDVGLSLTEDTEDHDGYTKSFTQATTKVEVEAEAEADLHTYDADGEHSTSVTNCGSPSLTSEVDAHDGIAMLDGKCPLSEHEKSLPATAVCSDSDCSSSVEYDGLGERMRHKDSDCTTDVELRSIPSFLGSPSGGSVTM
jgi:hypothetical protein